MEINEAIFNSWKEFIDKYGQDGLFNKPFYAVVVTRFVEIIPIYFLSSKNPKSVGERLGEMKKVINMPIYQEAINNVDSEKLTSFQRQIWKLMKSKSPLAIMLTFRVKEFIKSLKK